MNRGRVPASNSLQASLHGSCLGDWSFSTNPRRRRSSKRELVRAQEEIKRIQSVPLVIGQFMEAIDQK